MLVRIGRGIDHALGQDEIVGGGGTEEAVFP